MTDGLIWLTQHPWQALALVLLIWAASHLIGFTVYAVAQARESRQRAELRQRQGLEAAMDVSTPIRAPGFGPRRVG